MKTKFKDISKACLKAISISVILNTIIYFAGKFTGLISTTLPVTPEGQTIGLSSVLIMSVIPVIIAVFIFWIISIFTSNSNLIFVILSVVILLASFVMPFNVPDISLGMALTLNFMHVVVAGSVIFFILNMKSASDPALATS